MVVEFLRDIMGISAVVFVWTLLLLDGITAHFGAIVAVNATPVSNVMIVGAFLLLMFYLICALLGLKRL